MIALLSAALFVLLGYQLTLLWLGDDVEPLERALYAAVAGFALQLATLWLLAITHTFTRTALIIRAILLVVAVVSLMPALRRRMPDLRQVRVSPVMIAFFPLVVWISFILWRGALVPPLTHDALSYHLPKATLVVRHAGYDHLPYLNPAIRPLPMNYELLLAEDIAWMGTDKYTEWVSLLFFGLLMIAAGALAERWWANRLAAAAVMLCVAGVPVVLLHSGAHKNDVMVSAFMVAALVAVGRWIRSDDFRALLLCIVAMAIAIGTKPQAAALAVFLAPVIVWRLWRHPRRLAALAFVTVISFLALGGAVYISNLVHEGSLLNSRTADRNEVEIVPYGEWENFWQGPYVLLAAPFSRSEWSLSVPWEERAWFWRRYELFFSHLGVVFAVCALAAPIVFLFALRGPVERVIVTLAVLATFAVMLPVGFKPHGLYLISLPRYALFIVPVIFCWTIAPLVARLPQRPATAIVFAASIVFIAQAREYGTKDLFVPLSYLQYARTHPGTRVVAFDPNRAASLLDRAAGPRDRVAIDAGFGTWIQPAFGADLKRPVDFIPDGEGTPQLANDVKWVAVDRAFASVWGHPDFKDLSQARQYLARGKPAPNEVRVLDALLRDPRFEPVFYDRRTMQALFRRVR